jgi:uncharacterized protein YegP (UPF0339 family)
LGGGLFKCKFSKNSCCYNYPYIFSSPDPKVNLNFELALNNSVIMIPTKNYADRPKTKSVIALTKIGQHDSWHRIKAGIAFGDCSPAGFQTRGTYVLKVWVLFLAEFRCSRLMFWRKVGNYINQNFELALNNSVIMLPTKNYIDRPKSKSAIALTKIILKICTFSKFRLIYCFFLVKSWVFL